MNPMTCTEGQLATYSPNNQKWTDMPKYLLAKAYEGMETG